MVWQKGQRLQSGKYVIEEVLGRGGFGITYKALHVELDEQVVIKTPDKYLRDDSEYNKYVERFIKEGRMLARMSRDPHPHIVRVRDFFKEGNTHCLVMDFVPGETLFEVVKRRGTIPEAEIVRYIRQIGEALAVVHQGGLVHRDAHPGNIMLRENSKAVLIDFGIAKEVVPATQSSTGSAGNQGFAPYEQLVKGSREPNVDVYCLAATLYYAVTGQRPPTSLDRKLYNTALIPPKEIISGISDRLNQAILKGMALEAEDRPQSMNEWLKLLETPPVVNPPPKTPQVVNPTSEELVHQREVIRRPSQSQRTSSSSESLRSTNKDSGKRISQVSPNLDRLTRRRLMQWLGLGVAGLIATLLGLIATLLVRNLWQFFSKPKTIPTVSTVPGSKFPLTAETSLPDSTDETLISDSEFKFDFVTVNAKGEVTNQRSSQAEFFSEDLGSGVTLEMVSISGGTFKMGAPEGEEGSFDNERPQHEITIQPFFMGKFQVTQAQWQAVMNNNPSYFKGDKRPVERVSWNDAVEFCERLSKKTGRKYRLPSEAEWEYACRAGTTTPFHFGETITTDLANYHGKYTYGSGPKGVYRKKTTTVGSFPPNAFGLYDMHGNVWEWCANPWHNNYEGVPSNSSAWETGGDKSYRLLRGGSWYDRPSICRSAYRFLFYPDADDYYFGLRVVCAALRTS